MPGWLFRGGAKQKNVISGLPRPRRVGANLISALPRPGLVGANLISALPRPGLVGVCGCEGWGCGVGLPDCLILISICCAFDLQFLPIRSLSDLYLISI